MLGGILGSSNAGVVFKLLEKISKSLNGSLDGQKFEATSPNGSQLHKRIFVFKGWVKDGVGPAIRFRVKLGDLYGAEIGYAPDAGEFQDTDEGKIDLDLNGTTVALTFDFKDKDGKTHTAEFHT